MLTIASAATLPLRSLVTNGRRPNMWQIELMLHVAWWSTQTRTRPAQTRALRAAPRVPPSSHPSANGRASDTTHQTGKSASITTMSRSASRSAAWRRHDVRCGGEEPTDVGVPQALHLTADASSVVLRRVRIGRRVGEDVVPTVVGHPTDRSALVRHRAERDEDELERSAGGERLVGEEAMEADRHAVADEQVERPRRGARRGGGCRCPRSGSRRTRARGTGRRRSPR